MGDGDLQKRLREIGEALKSVPRNGTRYKRLMEELDELLGTKETPRNREAEAAWERRRRSEDG